jgi:penicillin-binding protein 2
MDSPIYEDLSPILKRARVVFILAAIVFGIVLFFYWKIQILDYKKFWSLAESNRTRDIVIPAPRALLTDRNGAVILANSIVSFKVSLIRENTRNLEESLRRISPLLGLDAADRQVPDAARVSADRRHGQPVPRTGVADRRSAD